MYLYLVRHGIAVPRDASNVAKDADRLLTARGAERFQLCVRGLKRLKIGLDEIWTSPLVRAEATARLLADGFPAAKLRIERALSPDGDREQLIRRLRSRHSNNGVALVGHEPFLSEFCTSLMGGRGSSVRLKKGGVACLEVDDLNLPLHGDLCWLLMPRQLKMIE